ncbi:MAG TPA: hypothetical protein DIT62_09500 [Alphaproteobacteria bacterium]|nr:hypothetical protein [Alphaproteobacteria bacterium]
MMRFLIFNISVLAALGYLFTASPDQSFSTWISGWVTGTSKTVVAQIDDVMMDGKETIDQTASTFPAAPTQDVAKLEDEIRVLKSDIADLTTNIEILTELAMAEAAAPATPSSSLQIDAGQQSVNGFEHVAAPVPEVELNTISSLNRDQDIAPVDNAEVADAEAADAEVTDADIANAFNAIAEADQINQAKQVAPDLNPSDPGVELQYMTPHERINDLSKLMIDMQVFYLEQSGV